MKIDSRIPHKVVIQGSTDLVGVDDLINAQLWECTSEADVPASTEGSLTFITNDSGEINKNKKTILVINNKYLVVKIKEIFISEYKSIDDGSSIPEYILVLKITKILTSYEEIVSKLFIPGLQNDINFCLISEYSSYDNAKKLLNTNNLERVK